MEIKTGQKVFAGIAIGKIRYIKKTEKKIVRTKIDDVEAEMARYEAARETALHQLNELYEKTSMEIDEKHADIFKMHAMLIEDVTYVNSVHDIINTHHVNAEYAIAATCDNFTKVFESFEDEMFRSRVSDIKDITKRVIGILMDIKNDNSVTEPVILVSEDLTPSETIQIDKEYFLGLATLQGSVNSHTAILARTLGIPALVGVHISEDWDGHLAIVDGYESKIIVDPDEQMISDYLIRKTEEEEAKTLLLEYRGRDNITKSGKRIDVFCNITNPTDIPAVIKNDAGGIGLFRSEYLYLETDDFPTEEEQYMEYRKTLEAMEGKKVIIRTLDVGADKRSDYLGIAPEENPAMGLRAIRYCLTREDIFRTQLRALFRASNYGNLAIMYPFITSLDEIKRIKKITASVKRELQEEGYEIGHVEEGIMIETPAAALISDILAQKVDFFSVGTNDLTQYTLAIDRQNSTLIPFYDSHHEAVIRLIKMVVENAHRAGIWAGICGELAAEKSMAKVFIDMGVDELSVSPAIILSLRKHICELD